MGGGWPRVLAMTFRGDRGRRVGHAGWPRAARGRIRGITSVNDRESRIGSLPPRN